MTYPVTRCNLRCGGIASSGNEPLSVPACLCSRWSAQVSDDSCSAVLRVVWAVDVGLQYDSAQFHSIQLHYTTAQIHNFNSISYVRLKSLAFCFSSFSCENQRNQRWRRKLISTVIPRKFTSGLPRRGAASRLFNFFVAANCACNFSAAAAAFRLLR